MPPCLRMIRSAASCKPPVRCAELVCRRLKKGELESQKKWGPALLPAPTAPSEGSARSQNQVPGEPYPEFRLTSSGVASHRPLPPKRSLATSTPVRQPKPRFCFAPPGLTEVKADRCSAALLGMTSQLRPALPPTIETAGSRVALSKDHLFRRLVPAGPASTPERASALPAAEIGALATRRTFEPLPALWWGLGPPSRSHMHPDSPFRVAPSEKCGNKPVDNVDIGNNPRNLS